MRKSARLIFIVSCLVFILSCATTTKIKVKVLKPAEIDIGNIKKIAVIDFGFEGEWHFWKGGKGVGKLLVNAVGKKLGLVKEKPVLLPPDPLTAYPGEKVTEKFIAKLEENGTFTVLKREQILRILRKQNFSITDEISDSQAVYIGNLLGVDAVIIGSGGYSVKDYSRSKKYTKKENDSEIKYKEYKLIRVVNVQMSYKLVGIPSGAIVVSRNNTVSNCSNNKKIFDTCEDYSEDSKEDRAFKNLTEWRLIVDRLVDSVLTITVNEIAPHYVMELRTIKSGKTTTMKAGMDYAKRGFWEDAKKSWEYILTDNSEEGKSDHMAALYNLGIYYEIKGDLGKADSLFDKCFKLFGRSECLDCKLRIQKRKEELKKLSEQNNR